MPTIAIVGASENRQKFGNKAVRAYVFKGYTVYPIHPKADTIEGQKVYRSVLDVPGGTLNRVSLYVPPSIGMSVVEEIAKRGAEEVWLNPGSESNELLEKAKSLGLATIAACSIVNIGVNPSQFD